MARILVSGGGGFVGRPCLDHLLARGHEVHCLTRSPTDIAGVTCHQTDMLADTDALAGIVAEIKPQRLLHLAWSAEPGAFWQARNNLDWLAASLRLYRAFVAADGERVVMAGTCAEYDWSADNTAEPLDERSSMLTPATLYGQAKKSLFDVLKSAAPLDGVSLATGRIFFLYGPGEKTGRVVSDVILNLLRGLPVETTAGTQLRDFMHVDDIAGAFAALLDSDVEGAVNIASGVEHPLSELLGEIGNQLGRSDLLKLGARPMAANDPPRLAARVSRLQDDVGFTPKFDLNSGLTNTIDWWRGELKREPSA